MKRLVSILLLFAIITLCVSTHQQLSPTVLSEVHGSGYMTIRRETIETEPEDNERGDVSETYDETLNVKLKDKRSVDKNFKSCSHPETSKSIKPGHFSYNKDTCLMCMCPGGKLKCDYAC